MLLSYGMGAVFIFINFLSLRQSVTPAPMLGRMTSTMRWLILLPAGPGRAAGRLAGRTRRSARRPRIRRRQRRCCWRRVASRLKVIRSVKTLPTLRAEAITPYSAEMEAD